MFLSNKNCDHISTSIIYTFLNRFDDCDYNVAINVRMVMGENDFFSSSFFSENNFAHHF